MWMHLCAKFSPWNKMKKERPMGVLFFYDVLFQTEYNRWAVSIILH